MASTHWTTNHSKDWLGRATKPDVLGFYTHCEVTEVIGFPEGGTTTTPVNVFSIVVLGNYPHGELPSPAFLNPSKKPIELKALKGWKFGVYRYFKPLEELASALEQFGNTSEWKLSGKLLQTGDMAPVAPQFVPPDATETIPVNRVLKNNFWNGSYILEWFDASKCHLQVLMERPPRLQELSEAIQKYLPLQLASLSDRLGNLIVQIPITVLIAEFHRSRELEGFSVQAAWHPQASQRPLRATCSMEFDGVFCGYAAAELQPGSTTIPAYDSSLSNRHLIWDQQNQFVLAATGPLAYMTQISMAMEMADPEPRTFKPNNAGDFVKVTLKAPAHRSIIGEPDSYTHREWTRRRIYDEEALRLAAERSFVQYRPKPGEQAECRKKAINDVRFLIDKHGQGGVWLWDPYLSGRDIIDTLFYCKYSNADLRGLTAGKEPPDFAPKKQHPGKWFQFIECLRRVLLKRRQATSDSKSKYIAEQQAVLDGVGGNYRGLCLKYRVKVGNAGWNFHDRFLIFPDANGQTLAWSLGTSVNSLGTAHHILQRVDNGRLVMEAFLDLWGRLDGPEHAVWEKP